MKKPLQHLLQKKGFTMFFAVLVSSLALAIGLAIFDLVSRELSLSSTTAQSEYAIYAADSGAECALYWDFKYNGTESIFPTSTTDTTAQNASGAFCNGKDVTVGRTMSTTATSGFTTTTIPFDTGYVILSVQKTVVSGVVHTTIYSQGFNTTATTSPNAVERELRVSY